METQDRDWKKLKGRYLREVRKALSRVRQPRSADVLEDVGAHLDRRYAELNVRRRTPEGLKAIIEQMGPPGDYAEILSPEPPVNDARARLKCLCSAGLAVAVVLTVVLLGVALSEETVAYVIRFKPVAPFHPQSPEELLAAFNDAQPQGIRTHHFRTRMDGDTLTGLICVDTERARDEIIKMLRQHDKLMFLGAHAASAEDFRAHATLGPPAAGSSGDTQTYLVTFKPVRAFAPMTSRELLNAFNADYPRGVQTHHYRAQVKGGILVGQICVDAEAGRDAIISMLQENEKLELVKVELAPGQSLGDRSGTGRRSTAGGRDMTSASRGPLSRKTRTPSTRNNTVSRTGEWPDGNASISGQIYRKARISRVSHGKVCLSSSEYGEWIVEVEDQGRFEFRNIPAGTYALRATDTFGYQDTYYRPDAALGVDLSFQLKEGAHQGVGIWIEPARPYRRIRGTILNEQSEPITGDNLTVIAWVQKSQGRRRGQYEPLSRSSVGPDGSYTLDELDGRPVYVQVRDGWLPVEEHPYPPRFHPATFDRGEAELVTFGEVNLVEGIDVRMQRTGGRVLEGRVTDGATGAPIPEALVTTFHADMWFDLFHAYTDEQGRYRVEGLSDGQFVIHVDAVHKGYVKTRRIVTLRRSAPPLDLALKRGANISGILVDERGNRYRAGRSFGHADRREGGFGGAASNFPYGNKYAPDYIRNGSTVFYTEGQGEAAGTMMVFPSDTTFLLPAVAPGKIAIEFRPRGRGERVQAILHEGRDIQETGLVIGPGQEITDVTIVIAKGADR